MLPPYLMVALGALGAAALTKFIATENRRVNDILDKQKPPEDGAAEPAPTPLDRDPVTGAYRPRAQGGETSDEHTSR